MNGILVPPNDVARLEAALARVMSDPEFRNELAEGTHRIVDRFGRERTMRLWNSALGLNAGVEP
jgi:glycosyltransferase involved in cell wall biosynthesis